MFGVGESGFDYDLFIGGGVSVIAISENSITLKYEGNITHSGTITIERLSDGETVSCILEWHNYDLDGKYFFITDCFGIRVPELNTPIVNDELWLPEIDYNDIEIDDNQCYFSNVTKQPNPLDSKGFYIVVKQLYPIPAWTRERIVIKRISTGATSSTFMDILTLKSH